MVPIVMGLEHPPLAEVHLAEREVPPRERAGVDRGQPLERLAAPLAGGPHVAGGAAPIGWPFSGRTTGGASRGPGGQAGKGANPARSGG